MLQRLFPLLAVIPSIYWTYKFAIRDDQFNVISALTEMFIKNYIGQEIQCTYSSGYNATYFVINESSITICAESYQPSSLKGNTFDDVRLDLLGYRTFPVPIHTVSIYEITRNPSGDIESVAYYTIEGTNSIAVFPIPDTVTEFQNKYKSTIDRSYAPEKELTEFLTQLAGTDNSTDELTEALNFLTGGPKSPFGPSIVDLETFNELKGRDPSIYGVAVIKIIFETPIEDTEETEEFTTESLDTIKELSVEDTETNIELTDDPSQVTFNGEASTKADSASPATETDDLDDVQSTTSAKSILLKDDMCMKAAKVSTTPEKKIPKIILTRGLTDLQMDGMYYYMFLCYALINCPAEAEYLRPIIPGYDYGNLTHTRSGVPKRLILDP